MMQRYLPDSQATEEFAIELRQMLPPQGLVFLIGDLGAGKTSLVRGYLRAAGFLGTVKSPTYTLVEEYTLGQQKIFHFDLYRLTDPEELEWMGIRDYLTPSSLCFIEWPEKGKGFLPDPDALITLRTEGEGRLLTLERF